MWVGLFIKWVCPTFLHLLPCYSMVIAFVKTLCQLFFKFSLRCPQNTRLIFSQLDGKPLLPNTVTHNWINLVRRIGLEGIRLHDARHSHASLMLKVGTHPKIVQERLGHASIQVTLDTYSHVAPGLQEAAAKRFDDVVLSKEADFLRS